MICAGCNHNFADNALFCPNCGRPKVREATGDALVGKVLGERFQVHELIGQGGSGTIYRAEHITLRRKVAIKVLHNELSRDDLAVERFRREATTVAEIDNEHIVEIHDFGRTPDGRLYLAMELLEGETLDSVIAREGTLSVERAADILIQVGEAMMEAHAIGYVHRDIRPRNIYLAVRRGKANYVKLLDFGLAKLVETEAGAASTSLGMTFGDPRYMSPEQARGDRIDRRADLYQLGCVAYEMLTGQPPFTGNRVFDILTKQVTDIPAPLPTRRAGVPLWMEAGVAKMLAKDPENRFATTTRMVEALRRGLETGEVMEDEIARRRESIPPPSVSRVMQRMGLPLDGAIPDQPLLSPVAVPAPAKPPAAAVPAPAKPPAAAVPAPALPPVKDPGATLQGTRAAKPEAVVVAAPAEDSGRKRTGTPRVGVPIVATPVEAPPVEESKVAAKEAVQPPITGVIEQPQGKKRPQTEPNISQSWFDDGDSSARVIDDDEAPPRARSRRTASTTDLNVYDDEAPRRRWALFATLALVAAIGGVVYAVSRGGSSSNNNSDELTFATHPTTDQQPVATPAQTIDAAPSEIIAAAPADAAEVVATPADAAPVAKAPDKTPVTPPAPPVVAKRDPKTEAKAEPKTEHRAPPTHEVAFPTSHRPPVAKDPDPEPPPSTDPDGDKKSEFFANLGQQQLGNGDIAGAAGNFKKAIDLDAKNVTAVSGQGEIALRQGAFADAIAHLTKASKLSPKSSKVFTLLGEAYLSSAQMKDAAANFKKALQLDPDNARARDGYNEASTHVPPPTDDTP